MPTRSRNQAEHSRKSQQKRRDDPVRNAALNAQRREARKNNRELAAHQSKVKQDWCAARKLKNLCPCCPNIVYSGASKCDACAAHNKLIKRARAVHDEKYQAKLDAFTVNKHDLQVFMSGDLLDRRRGGRSCRGLDWALMMRQF